MSILAWQESLYGMVLDYEPHIEMAFSFSSSGVESLRSMVERLGVPLNGFEDDLFCFLRRYGCG